MTLLDFFVIDYRGCLKDIRSTNLEKATIIKSDKSVGENRLAGFEALDSYYVSFCDADDSVVNIDALKVFLTGEKYDAVYTDSSIVTKDNFVINSSLVQSYPNTIHSLLVVEKNLAIKVTKDILQRYNSKYWNAFDYIFVKEIAKVVEWKLFPKVCYKWCLHSPNQLHHAVQKDIAELHRLYFS